MVNRTNVVLVLFFTSAFAYAVLGHPLLTNALADDDKPTTGFINRVHRQADRDSKYVIFIPHDYDGKKPTPTILFLHGYSQSGTDGLVQAERGLAAAIRKRERSFPFIVVFPQAHLRTEVADSWRAGSPDGKRAIAMLDEVRRDFRVDVDRVYLTGYSMGGHGTFSLAAAHPSRFAAIVPICGGASTSLVPQLRNVPCWCFVGDAEAPNTLTTIRILMKAIKDAGGRPIHHEYPGVGHHCFDQTYENPDVYEWLLTQSTRNRK